MPPSLHLAGPPGILSKCGYFLCSWRFMYAQTYSIGFRSGEYPGCLATTQPFSFNHSRASLGVWIDGLSCMNTGQSIPISFISIRTSSSVIGGSVVGGSIGDIGSSSINSVYITVEGWHSEKYITVVLWEFPGWMVERNLMIWSRSYSIQENSDIR